MEDDIKKMEDDLKKKWKTTSIDQHNNQKKIAQLKFNLNWL